MIKRKITLFQKICFSILLLPTLLVFVIVCFTLLYGKKITDGAIENAGNNFIKPLLISATVLTNFIESSETKGTKAAEKDFKDGKLRIYLFGELFKYEPEYNKLLAKHKIDLIYVNQSEMNKNWIYGYNLIMKPKIAEKYGKKFLDSLKQESIEIVNSNTKE